MNKYFKKSLNHNMKINIYNGYTPYQCQEREIKALTIINEIIKNKLEFILILIFSFAKMYNYQIW